MSVSTIAIGNSVEITIQKSFDVKEIWNSLTGSDFNNTSYWIDLIDTENESDTFDNPTSLKLIHADKDDMSKPVHTVVTPDMIYNAFGQLLEQGQTHCGGYLISDLDNSDACFADLVLQQAIFNNVVFG
jgi:hypothetical protein